MSDDDLRLARQAAGGALRRTVAIRRLCEHQKENYCKFPKCDGCGFDRMLDREADAAAGGKIKTREFRPDERQLIVSNAMHAAIGNVSTDSEDAIGLFVYSLTDYIEKICKPEFRTEAFLTVIECLRINGGMLEDESAIQG